MNDQAYFERLVAPAVRELSDTVEDAICDFDDDRWTDEKRERFEKMIREAALGFVQGELAAAVPPSPTI